MRNERAADAGMLAQAAMTLLLFIVVIMPDISCRFNAEGRSASAHAASPGRRRTQRRSARRTVTLVALGLVLAVAAPGLLASCGSQDWLPERMRDHHRNMMGGGRDSSSEAEVSGGLESTVRIKDFAYMPGNLAVPAGATVTFTNADSAPHSATDRGSAWDTGLFGKGQSRSIRLETPGEYRYYCSVHPDMEARITVR